MSALPQVEFFFSFRSPYSYLAAPRHTSSTA
jgi:2-hydroxychromene-2-carboxylate isomerase